jgi:cysteine desulfurase
MNDVVYLDHAATTPLDPAVLEAMQPYLTGRYFNPSAQYLAARMVRKDIEAARARIAYWFGARPSEIVFTAGGTEANNLAVHGVMGQFPDGNVVVSSIEHDAVLVPAGQYDCRLAPVGPDGIVDAGALLALVDDQTVLVSMMYANNELGTIQPIHRIAEALAALRKQRKRPLYFHVDACQAAAYLDLHAARLGVDMMTINASKIYGPKQVGALYVKAGTQLLPQVLGGGQERHLRSGTENVAGIIGLAKALDLVQERRHDETERLKTLQKLFLDLLAEKLPEARINGSQKHRLPNNVHLTIPGKDNERLMMQLDEQGVLVAVGSACSASSEEPSHVLKAIGMSDEEAQSSLRITMGRSTTEATVRKAVDVLALSQNQS